jgi:5-methylcytosine-specific restriction endonuclease McrA
VGAVSTRAPLIERNRWLWSARVKQVKVRDRYTCQWSDASCDGRLEVDHINARHEGGGDELSNLRLLCRRHHVARHNGVTGPARRGTSLARANAYSYGHPRPKVF